MIWSPRAWRVRRGRPSDATTVGALMDAYLCENILCGTVLDPVLHPRVVARPNAARPHGARGLQDPPVR